MRVSAVIFDDDATRRVFRVSDATKVIISCVNLSKKIPFPALEEGAMGKLILLSSSGAEELFLESVFSKPDDDF